MNNIRMSLINLQKEKLDQLKEAVRKVDVSAIVDSMQDLNDDLIDAYNREEEGPYKLKVLDAIRKNYEFLVKVADVPLNLIPAMLGDSVKPEPVRTINCIDLDKEGNPIYDIQ